MSPSIEPFNEMKYKALIDGLECSEIYLSQIKSSTIRIDAEFYSKFNLHIQEVIRRVGKKTIKDLGGKLDCSAFYPAITEYYSFDQSLVPFLRVNEINNGLIEITENTVFLPIEILERNNNTIALAYPGDIIIAKGGNTLAKVGLVTDEFPVYATCRDVIILRTKDLIEIDKFYLWAFLHCSYGQGLLWRSASQTGQPHLTLPDIVALRVPEVSNTFQNSISQIYALSVSLKNKAKELYLDATHLLNDSLQWNQNVLANDLISIKTFSETFLRTGRLDAEYYQPKYDQLLETLSVFSTKVLGGADGVVNIKKSIEPGSDVYCEEGIPFIRVSDVTKFGISEPEIHLPTDVVLNPEYLFPKKNTILFSKDGSVGIAYKMEKDAPVITSGALLHLTVKNPEEVLPDYLTLVLNSPVVHLQAERDSNGAIIQHWKPSEIENVIIPILDIDIQKEIAQKVQKSFSLRRKGELLLGYAKQAVEMAIEQGEETAIKWLESKVSE